MSRHGFGFIPSHPIERIRHFSEKEIHLIGKYGDKTPGQIPVGQQLYYIELENTKNVLGEAFLEKAKELGEAFFAFLDNLRLWDLYYYLREYADYSVKDDMLLYFKKGDNATTINRVLPTLLEYCAMKVLQTYKNRYPETKESVESFEIRTFGAYTVNNSYDIEKNFLKRSE